MTSSERLHVGKILNRVKEQAMEVFGIKVL